MCEWRVPCIDAIKEDFIAMFMRSCLWGAAFGVGFIVAAVLALGIIAQQLKQEKSDGGQIAYSKLPLIDSKA